MPSASAVASRPVDPGGPSAGRLSRRKWRMIATVLGVLLAVSSFLLLARSSEVPELGQLSDSDRRALYQRTFSDLELCATTAGSALADHCRHQAELILNFPECDSACRQLAGSYAVHPTR